jgi:hypothetical protein
MVATHQVRGKDGMGALVKGRLTVVGLVESCGCILCQLLRLMPKALLLEMRHRTYYRVHYGSST